MQNARQNDLFSGTCWCHPPIPCIGTSGIIITSSPNTFCNNRGQARLGDIVLGFCGHIGVIVSSSPNSNCNNLGMARLGDSVAGCLSGTIITGSPDTQVN